MDTVWWVGPLDERELSYLETAETATFRLRDVRGDGNCFYYAILRASKAKRLKPGIDLLPDDFDVRTNQMTKSGRDIIPRRKEMRRLKQMFRNLFTNPKIMECQRFQNNINTALVGLGWTRNEFVKNLILNKDFIQFVPGVHDLMFHCLFGIHIRVYNEGSDSWQGEYANMNPNDPTVVNLYHEPDTDEQDGHYMWLDPIGPENPALSGGGDDMLLRNLQFDPAWFGDIKPNTLENHRKRLEILQQHLPNIDLVQDIQQIVDFVEKRYKAPFNVYSTLRKMLRKVAPDSIAYEIIQQQPTGYNDPNHKMLHL